MNKRIKKKKGIKKDFINQDELWNLDLVLAKYILPRLIGFKKMKLKSEIKSHPNGITYDEWIQILDEMIWTFDYYINKPKNETQEELLKNRVRYLAGMSLFAEYFCSLWD